MVASALVYSGFLRKVGEISTGVGWIPPTTANMLLVHERLQMLVFPWKATILYAVAFALRFAIMTWVIFPSAALLTTGKRDYAIPSSRAKRTRASALKLIRVRSGRPRPAIL